MKDETMGSTPPQSAEAYHYDTSPAGIGATRLSASVVVPMLMKLFRPASVLDVGCGLGDWLAEFQKHGCKTVKGMDGGWVPTKNLQISHDEFQAIDLTAPVKWSDRFDLALSFEVAEHFDAAAGDRLVALLTGSADIVAFGAAIPAQGGYRHVNEQFQSYWIAKFAAYGYSAYDLIRPQIWMNDECCWWYQQNILIYASEMGAARFGLQKHLFIADLVHPRIYNWHRAPENWGGRMLTKMLIKKLLGALSLR